MNKVPLTLLFFITAAAQLRAQILPKEGSMLNYRLVGFSFPQSQNEGTYLLEIASGNYNSEDSFKKNIVVSAESGTNKIIAEVPSFGRQYTWHVVAASGRSEASKKTFYHFSTGIAAGVDTNTTRLRVIQEARKFNDAYVFIDGCRALYDMAGHPVWYLPNIDSMVDAQSTVTNLHITPQGAVTFLATISNSSNALEVNYDGAVTWKAPKHETINGGRDLFYHHDFTRLKNGHYMVITNEIAKVYRKANAPGDSSLLITTDPVAPDNARLTNPATSSGVIAEYDEKGGLAWSFNTSICFNGSDLVNYKWNKGIFDPHINAFYFDETTQMLYISFKIVSRVVKVKYPEGIVMYNYGTIFKPGADNGDRGPYVPPDMANGLFCGQHSCKCSQKDYLYLFNNNDCKATLPSIIMMQQPVNVGDTLKKIWEYQCQVEDADKDRLPEMKFSSGGSVEELPDGSLFATMSSGYSKLFIIGQDKEILWSAVAETWNPDGYNWRMPSIYRASMITSRKDMERLIWNSEAKQ